MLMFLKILGFLGGLGVLAVKLNLNFEV